MWLKWMLIGMLSLPISALAESCIAIGTVPAVIDAPGCYVLKRDVRIEDISTNAITINSDDVSFNLNGHSIIGPRRRARATGAGIYAQGVRRLHIHNGRINGFLYGVRVDQSKAMRSANVTMTGMTFHRNAFRGLMVEAEHAVIVGNRVSDTGGTMLFPDAFAIAIEVKGRDCRISHNVVRNVYPRGVGEGVGVSLSNERAGCEVDANQIMASNHSGASFGIWLVNEDVPTLVRENQISGFLLPFNLIRSHDPTQVLAPDTHLESNVVTKSACGISSYPSYYDGLSKSNRIANDSEACPLLIHEAQHRYDLYPKDSRVVFQLGMAKYQCRSQGRMSAEECCQSQREAIEYYEEAAKLGVGEAIRVLPAVKAAVSSSELCRTPSS